MKKAIKIIPKYRKKPLTDREKRKNKYLGDLITNRIPYILRGKYIDAKTPTEHECLICHKIELKSPTNVLRSKNGCRECSFKAAGENRLVSHADFIAKIPKETLKLVEIIGAYEGSHKKILCRCKICGEQYQVLASALLLGRGHQKCSNLKVVKARMKTEEQFLSEIEDVFHGIIKICSKYISTRDVVLVECQICGNQWNAWPTNLLRGNGCKKCASRNIAQYRSYSNSPLSKTTEQFKVELAEKNPTVYLIGDYISTSHKCHFGYKICGHDWYSMPSGYINIKRLYGCPECNGRSKGESIIRNILNANNISFDKWHTFDGLIGLGGKPLSYDFYLPDFNFLIEVQGEQHRKAIDFFGGEERFLAQQEHDKRKRDYAKAHGIELLEIWPEDLDNISQILSEKLNIKLVSVETTGVA